jgi:hypothetical protein
MPADDTADHSDGASAVAGATAGRLDYAADSGIEAHAEGLKQVTAP